MCPLTSLIAQWFVEGEERSDRFKVIGGDLADRLIPVPLSKTPTDQAVRWLVVVSVHQYR